LGQHLGEGGEIEGSALETLEGLGGGGGFFGWGRGWRVGRCLGWGGGEEEGKGEKRGEDEAGVLGVAVANRRHRAEFRGRDAPMP
jgi:hypothetical protein